MTFFFLPVSPSRATRRPVSDRTCATRAGGPEKIFRLVDRDRTHTRASLVSKFFRHLDPPARAHVDNRHCRPRPSTSGTCPSFFAAHRAASLAATVSTATADLGNPSFDALLVRLVAVGDRRVPRDLPRAAGPRAVRSHQSADAARFATRVRVARRDCARRQGHRKTARHRPAKQLSGHLDAVRETARHVGAVQVPTAPAALSQILGGARGRR